MKRGRPPAKKSMGFQMEENSVTKKKKERNEERHEEQCRSGKQPKRVAAWPSIKEASKASTVAPKEEKPKIRELAAIAVTRVSADDVPPSRKLLDFMFHGADGNPLPIEASEVTEVFISSIIIPSDGLENETERGVRCKKFAKIQSWAISLYDEDSPVIWISTMAAEYRCMRPNRTYRKFFDHLLEKAWVCLKVQKTLRGSKDDILDMPLNELIAKVIRSLRGNECFAKRPAGRDFVISLGEFIYEQLIKLDKASGNGRVKLETVPGLISLQEECKSQMECMKPGSPQTEEGKDIKLAQDSNEKLARLLQDEEDRRNMRRQGTRQPAMIRNKFCFETDLPEITAEYPSPGYYKARDNEMDEEFYNSETDETDELPRRILQSWALYDSNSRFVSIEKLPMKTWMDSDVPVFGSGCMTKDDGSCCCTNVDPAQDNVFPVFLSAVKEWAVEFNSMTISISIRTDASWYKLGKPARQYAPWYEPVLRVARLVEHVIKLIKKQSRASRLTFSDATKEVAELEKDKPAYISSSVKAVEQYMVVHGQMILKLFAEYPERMIRQCPFVSGLRHKMEEKLQTKQTMRNKVKVHKEASLKQNAGMVPVLSKREKLMQATTTRMINRIWKDYYSRNFPEETREGDDHGLIEEELEEEDEEKDILAVEDKASRRCSLTASASNSSRSEIKWEGKAIKQKGSHKALYKCALVRGVLITIGGAVIVTADDSERVPTMVLVEYMFEKRDGLKMGHGRILLKGSQTVLENAANEREVFLTNDCMEFELRDVSESVVVNVRSMPWGYEHRKKQAHAEKIDRAKAEEKKKKGLPLEFYCKSFYCPEKGAFVALPVESLGLGTGACSACKIRETQRENFQISSSKTSFIYRKTRYKVNDFVYARPQHFNEDKKNHKTCKYGRNVGLKAYVVCQLLGIEVPAKCTKIAQESAKLRVRRFYRPDDVSKSKSYSSDIREVYYSEDLLSIPVGVIEGKCEVIRKKSDLPELEFPVIVDHVFFCQYSYDPVNGALNQLPAHVKLTFQTRKAADKNKLRNNKRKAKCGGIGRKARLASLDIFAGCGGLSEGLQQSGVSFTKWAIENDMQAGEAFRLNHPETQMFVDDCNIILSAIMQKCGDADDCISTSEGKRFAANLDKEKLSNLPLPGQVDFIYGGPPCQGFTSMNRFNQSPWSKGQREMLLTFLSFAEYFRPRFFLLENVKNFVSFNKGSSFRLTIASLLEMGYQVRFGILEAGAYGVSQSRKRAFVWAASPEETLPEWPEPMHAFACRGLKISLTADSFYVAMKSTIRGAPLRSLTVKDTIGDLPPVGNGASLLSMDYRSDPVSCFQTKVRGTMTTLKDHISKEMNELNLIRCKRVPKRPGADWRCLPKKRVKLSNGQTEDLIPRWMINTAKRNNQWKGLLGRLDWQGNFPTVITDPQPLGKVGTWFHPEQDRILTVRECARSQGFPDSYKFSGNIQDKHKQIGNAVPPPLAYALGRKLKEAVDKKQSSI